MLENLSMPNKVTSCRVRIVKSGLSDVDAKILDEAVMNPGWQLTVLSRELKKKNILISDNSLRRHRTKVCSCWKI
jgi:hypothetical protein